MGRIRQMINVHGRASWTLFDSGARKTYITPAVASVLTTSLLARPVRTALAGSHKETSQVALLEAEVAEVEGLPISRDGDRPNRAGRRRPIRLAHRFLASTPPRLRQRILDPNAAISTTPHPRNYTWAELMK